jgi:large subunit ribosomal protein L13
MPTKTYTPKKEDIQRKWFVVDAEGKTLGRLATRVATILRGKHKPMYTPHLDVGDYVIVVNAEKVRLTGQKEWQKTYYRHTGYPGGIKATSYQDMIDRHPDRVIRFAIKGMLPDNVLGRQQLSKLKIYAGPDHPHGGAQPEELNWD